jgi:hypothetical protein
MCTARGSNSLRGLNHERSDRYNVGLKIVAHELVCEGWAYERLHAYRAANAHRGWSHLRPLRRRPPDVSIRREHEEGKHYPLAADGYIRVLCGEGRRM